MAAEKKPVNVQISRELFLDLCFYFRLPADARSGTQQEQRIKDQLQERFERWYNREVFSAYRESDNPEDRERHLSEYLERTGVPEDLRTMLTNYQDQEGD